MCELCNLLEQLEKYQGTNESDRNTKEILIIACQRHNQIVKSLNELKEEIKKIQPNIVLSLENTIDEDINYLYSLINQNNFPSKNIERKLKIIKKLQYDKFYLDLNNLYEELKPHLRRSIRNFGNNINIYEELIENKKLDFIFNLCSDFDLKASDEPSLKQKLLIWITQKLRLYFEAIENSRETSLEKKKDGQTYTDESLLQSHDNQQQIHNKIIINVLENLKDYIENNVDNKLKSCHVSDRSDCNCQYLIMELSQIAKNPQTLKAISQELNMNQDTVTSHWKRNCLPLYYELAFTMIDQQDLSNLLNEKQSYLEDIYFENKPELNAYFITQKMLINSEDIAIAIKKIIKQFKFIDEKQKARFRNFCKHKLLKQLYQVIFN